MDCEERLLSQAAMVKAVNPDTKVFVYRNLVKALPWYTSVWKKLADPAFSGWFLPFSGSGNYHVPACDTTYSPPLCSDRYHDQDQTPKHPHGDGSCTDLCDCGGVPCGECEFGAAGSARGGRLAFHATSAATTAAMRQRKAAAATRSGSGNAAPSFTDLATPPAFFASRRPV
jgi:hypothetical protein